MVFALKNWVDRSSGLLATDGALAVGQIESTTYLRNQLLRDSDWASMDHSVELRTPLVDAWLLRDVSPALGAFGQFPNKRLAGRGAGQSAAGSLDQPAQDRVRHSGAALVERLGPRGGQHWRQPRVGAGSGARLWRGRQMRLVHVVPRIDQEAAGPSYSVPRLCQSLAACGNDVELTCLAARGEIADVAL